MPEWSSGRRNRIAVRVSYKRIQSLAEIGAITNTSLFQSQAGSADVVRERVSSWDGCASGALSVAMKKSSLVAKSKSSLVAR